MARFSFGGDDNGNEGGPSRLPNPNPKKRMRLQMKSPNQSPQDRYIEREASPSSSEASDQENYNSSQNTPQFLPGNSPEPYRDDEDEDDDEDVPVTGSCSNNGNSRAVGDVADDSVMTLSDPDVLDCPICLDYLTIPVFQCENGHIACSSCSSKVRNKCPSCILPIGYNRCRAIEKVIESVKISCRNFKYGCMEKTSYCKKNEHENTCTYAPCTCPQVFCPFVGSLSQLSAHFTSDHPNIAMRFHFDNTFPMLINPNQKYIILQENGGMLFILINKEFQSLGNLIAVSCVKPSTSREKFSYYVVARKDGCVVKLESLANNVAKRFESWDQKRFLMVPREFIDSCGKLKFEVNISNLHSKTPPRVVKAHLGDSICN